MYLPNYKDGSIVNLMSSISLALNGKHRYKELGILKAKELKKSKNVVLVVVDGLSYEYLIKKHKNSFFYKNLKGKITSVFPSTTASASTSFKTGVAPQQHAITGWIMYLKELGVVSTILPFYPRFGGMNFIDVGVDPKQFFEEISFTDKIKAKTYFLTTEEIASNPITSYISGHAKIYAYSEIDDFFLSLKYILKDKKRKYVYAYMPQLDEVSHHYGVNSKKTAKLLILLNSKFEKFVKTLSNDTTLIITADHGFIDVPRNHTIDLNQHQKFVDCLTLPVCGEGRAAYCYVKPSKDREFRKYVKEKLSKYCDLYKSEDLIKRNFFGLFEPNKKLFDRVGDYVLISKENYALRYSILGEKKSILIGHHGGVSKEEMFVPLIVVKK
jgi:predicted AlkP superfamily pyrophosphatase or phosphodiesterase